MSNDKVIFIGSQSGFATIISSISKYDPQGKRLRGFLRLFNFHTIKSMLEQLGAYNANYQPKHHMRTDLAELGIGEFIKAIGMPKRDSGDFLASIVNHECELFEMVSHYVKRTSFEFGWGVYGFEISNVNDGVILSFDGDYRIMEWERIHKENPELAPLCCGENLTAKAATIDDDAVNLRQHAVTSINIINTLGFNYLMNVGDSYYRSLCMVEENSTISLCSTSVATASTVERLWERFGDTGVQPTSTIFDLLGAIPGFTIEFCTPAGIRETPIYEAVVSEHITLKQLEQLDEILSIIAHGLTTNMS